MIDITPEQARANAATASHPVEQYYADLNNSIRVCSLEGKHKITFGFNRTLASEALVDGVVNQLLSTGYSVERLSSNDEQHFIRISWEHTSTPMQISGG